MMQQLVFGISSNGKQLYCVKQDKVIEDAIYTKDGKLIITGGDDGSVRIGTRLMALW